MNEGESAAGAPVADQWCQRLAAELARSAGVSDQQLHPQVVCYSVAGFATRSECPTVLLWAKVQKPHPQIVAIKYRRGSHLRHLAKQSE